MKFKIIVEGNKNTIYKDFTYCELCEMGVFDELFYRYMRVLNVVYF